MAFFFKINSYSTKGGKKGVIFWGGKGIGRVFHSFSTGFSTKTLDKLKVEAY